MKDLTIPRRPTLRFKRMSLEIQARLRLVTSAFLAEHGLIPRAATVLIPTVEQVVRDIADNKGRILPCDKPKLRVEASRMLRRHAPAGVLQLH